MSGLERIKCPVVIPVFTDSGLDRWRKRGGSIPQCDAGFNPDRNSFSGPWVRNKLQSHGAVSKGKGRGQHRRKRAPPGVMLHQDGSSHEWVKGRVWDLIGCGMFGASSEGPLSPTAAFEADRHNSAPSGPSRHGGDADITAANRYLAEVYQPAFNAEFRRSPAEDKSAFVPMAEIARLDDILPRGWAATTVCGSRDRRQLPASRYRPHYFKVRVKVRRIGTARYRSGTAPGFWPATGRWTAPRGNAGEGGMTASARSPLRSLRSLHGERATPVRVNSKPDTLCALKPDTSICPQHPDRNSFSGPGCL